MSIRENVEKKNVFTISFLIIDLNRHSVKKSISTKCIVGTWYHSGCVRSL